ncbi:MAG: tyrosine-protein phosphatase [Firmicutes bacterium]|nr:tyrosine-protein phosphatase [Bacillota bacterium]
MKRKSVVFLSVAISMMFASNVAAQTNSKMIPARQMLEESGFVSEWDAKAKTAVFKKDGYAVSVKAGDDHFEVNGKKIKFDYAVCEKDGNTYNAPVIIDGSFYLPDNELMQAIGANSSENDKKDENILDLDKQLLKDIEGISNARELGGYVNTEGKKIKSNVIIRTGKPSDGTDADLELLSKKYKVSDMVDFRSDSETQMAPEPTIEGVKNHHIPLNIAGDMSKLANDDIKQAYAKLMQGGDRGELLVTLAENKMLPTPKMYGYFLGDEAEDGYRQFFDILLNKPEDASVLFHCTQGKDRTGMGSALFLYALDFDDETVMADYMLTNEANKAIIEDDVAAASKYTDNAETIELVKAMSGVNEALLQSVIDEMNEKYGSVKGYLKTRIGLTDDDFEKLKDMYLE